MTVCNAVRGKFIIAALLRACGDSSSGGSRKGGGMPETGGEQAELLMESASGDKAIFSQSDLSPLVKC